MKPFSQLIFALISCCCEDTWNRQGTAAIAGGSGGEETGGDEDEAEVPFEQSALSLLLATRRIKSPSKLKGMPKLCRVSSSRL